MYTNGHLDLLNKTHPKKHHIFPNHLLPTPSTPSLCLTWLHIKKTLLPDPIKLAEKTTVMGIRHGSLQISEILQNLSFISLFSSGAEAGFELH